MYYPIPDMDGPVLFGSPVVKNQTQIVTNGVVPPVEMIEYFVNRTTKPLCISLRNGVRYVLKPTLGFGDSHLQIQMVHRVTVEAKESLREYLLGIDEDCSEEVSLFKDHFKNDRTLGHSYSATLMVLEYQVQYADILAAGGEVYYHEADVMISLSDIQHASPHPYSAEGRLAGMARAAPVNFDRSNFGLCMEIIDNTGHTPVKFINFLDRIYRVEPKKDPSRRDGLYIYSHQETVGKTSQNKPKTKFFALEGLEFEKHGLFGTHGDAKVRGDHTSSRKVELAQLEHENSRVKLEAQREKAGFELREMRLKHELTETERKANKLLTELEQERARTEHLMTLERLRYKDEFEQRSLQRKDTSELMKSLPAIVMGVGGAVLAVMTILKQVSSSK